MFLFEMSWPLGLKSGNLIQTATFCKTDVPQEPSHIQDDIYGRDISICVCFLNIFFSQEIFLPHDMQRATINWYKCFHKSSLHII